MINAIFKDYTKTPELVFGLVGPIGIDMYVVQNKLREALIAVGYIPQDIILTDAMLAVPVDDIRIDNNAELNQRYMSKIQYANKVREKCKNNAALAALAIMEIQNIRKAYWGSSQENNIVDTEDTNPKKNIELDLIPIEKNAYIIRQLKRPEEVELLRKVYGRKFIQISIHSKEDDRKKYLERDIAINNPDLTKEKCSEYAENLIITDLNEENNTYGQRITDVFHLGDVFINGQNEENISLTINRFIQALFGKNSISPTKDEYGSYIAASASLRSIDLSRQVGAAIFSPVGDVITMGCNEVPKFGGGTYWCDDEIRHRDFDDATDANRTEKNRIIFNFLDMLQRAGALADGKSAHDIYNDDQVKQLLKKASVSDITEFGRMTHAEMNALCDAAKLGRSTKNAIIFVTTFPCHNCAKHIIASGIKRVVFIEPYPKSKALAFHEDSVTMDRNDDKRVVFEHFVGISPRRYRDIFEKVSRKDGSKILEWYEEKPLPRIEDKGPSYVYNEHSAILSTLETIRDILIQDPNEPQY